MHYDHGCEVYSILAVSILTNVNPRVLLTWERRYGFPTPEAGAFGELLYSREQVRVIGRLMERARSGEAIGDLILKYRAGEFGDGAQSSEVEEQFFEPREFLPPAIGWD